MNYAEHGEELKEDDDRRIRSGHADCNEARTSWHRGWTDKVHAATPERKVR